MFGKRKNRREAIRSKLREKSEYKMKSENVAIPEIHTKDFDEIEEHIDEIEQEKEEKHSILYDNVAIPEVHLHKKKKWSSLRFYLNQLWIKNVVCQNNLLTYDIFIYYLIFMLVQSFFRTIVFSQSNSR